MSTLQDKLNALTPAKREAVRARAKELISEELTLRELRQKMDITQEVMAERLEVRQDNVSRLERRGDMKVSTLQEFVEALGGQLNVTVTLPDQDEEIRLAVAAG